MWYVLVCVRRGVCGLELECVWQCVCVVVVLGVCVGSGAVCVLVGAGGPVLEGVRRYVCQTCRHTHTHTHIHTHTHTHTERGQMHSSFAFLSVIVARPGHVHETHIQEPCDFLSAAL